MYANLLGKAGNTALYYLKKMLGEGAADTLSRSRFGARAPFPWIAAPEDFPVPVKVAYNAVGGSEFSKLPKRVQDRTLSHLEKATYLSVRDGSHNAFSPVWRAYLSNSLPTRQSSCPNNIRSSAWKRLPLRTY